MYRDGSFLFFGSLYRGGDGNDNYSYIRVARFRGGGGKKSSVEVGVWRS